MNNYLTTVSHNSTGVKTITCGFQPKGARITVSRNGVGDTLSHLSQGVTDGTNQVCSTNAADPANGYGYSDRFGDRMVGFYGFDVSGAPLELTRANFSAFTATEFKYDVITKNVNCQYLVEIWG